MRFSHDLGCVLYSCPRLEFHARAAACSHATVPSSSSSSSSRSRRAMLEGQYCEVSMSCRNRYAPRLISLSRIKTRRNKVSIIHKHFCFSLLSLTHNRRGYLLFLIADSRIEVGSGAERKAVVSDNGNVEEAWLAVVVETEVVEARIDVSPSCPAVTGACALASSRTSPTFLIRPSPCHGPLAIVTPWPPPLPPPAGSSVACLSRGLPPTVNQPPLVSSARQISLGRRPSWVGPCLLQFLLS